MINLDEQLNEVTISKASKILDALLPSNKKFRKEADFLKEQQAIFRLSIDKYTMFSTDEQGRRRARIPMLTHRKTVSNDGKVTSKRIISLKVKNRIDTLWNEAGVFNNGKFNLSIIEKIETTLKNNPDISQTDVPYYSESETVKESKPHPNRDKIAAILRKHSS